ncbi:acyltransferase family protein [Leucobacter sp. W1153]
MVATFHVWFGKVSGGVDVFLLVSAYLMTRSLVARSEKGTLTRPLSYLIRKFSRLLPAAVAAITLILIGAFVFLPVSEWRLSLDAALSSLFYVENLRLQDATVDYFNAEHSSASPFQHFWSLSVQGQVFILFAALHFIGDVLARYLGFSVRKTLLGLFATLALGSFAYSVWLTDQNQAFAYFDTGARIWELAVGSVLALIHPWLRISQGFRTVASWLGVIAILACGFVLPVDSSFPGWAALWPITAAALVIISAGPPTRFGADRLLAHGILNKLGGYTYALYLTHWPVLVFFLWTTGTEQANWQQGFVILLVSGVLSFLISRCIEQPVATWLKRDQAPRLRWLPQVGWRSPLVLLASISLILSATSVGTTMLDQRTQKAIVALQEINISQLGANAGSSPGLTVDPVPAEPLVEGDWVEMGEDCYEDDPYRSALCYEIPPTEGEAVHSLYAIGSSHSTQFNGALLEAVNRHPEWLFRTQVAPACYYSTQIETGEHCIELWLQATAYIAAEKPDLVVMFGTQSHLDYELIQPELLGWLQEVMATSPQTHFVVLRDNPRIPFSLFECATRHGYDSDKCVFRYETSTDPEYIAAIEQTGATWVDLNGHICPNRECRPSLGGVVTYFDEGHLTGTFTRTLAQKFSESVSSVVDWWPERVYEEGEFIDRANNSDTLSDLNQL